MEHTGEGHFSEYVDQEHTGIEAFKRRLQQGQTDLALSIGIGLCAVVMDGFKRYEKNTSSPSDSTSLVFGVYHSPITKQHVRSNFHKSSTEEFTWKVVKADYWVFPASLEQEPPSNAMVFQAAIFGELLEALGEVGENHERELHLPVAVHLESDLFTYRAMITFAEAYSLRLRLFPTHTHPQFDKYRSACEQKVSPIDGSKRKFRYHLVAYCPACAKHLLPETRLRCGGCKIAFYCNVECQKKDWNNLHKKECKKFSKLIAEADCEYCKKT